MNIAVLISGGVDSSVALRLLHEQGHSITAFYLKIWLEDELSYLGSCPWEEDLAYVRAVCKDVGVPLEVVPMQRAYWDRVVSYTIAEIKAGRTPNPDIFCNKRVKFGAFFDHIGDQFDKIATGHYARVDQADGRYRLLCAPDPIKDQTYFLSHISQKQLSRLMFPIGHLTKAQVRQEAQRFNIPNKNRKDSQGICFLGKIKFRDFVKHHVGESPGDLIEVETGNKVGTHAGFWFYTLGQRQGIGLSGGPWYVVAKDADRNIVYISRTYYSPEKARDSLSICDCNWLSGIVPEDGVYDVKLRHGAKRYACDVRTQVDGTMDISLHERDQGIAPGQFAVLYKNDECLGGGTILSEEKCVAIKKSA